MLRGVNLALGAGELAHASGANGSGKTTLLRVLAGLTQAEEGEIRWQAGGKFAAAAEIYGDIAFLGHKDGLDDSLTVHENVFFGLGLAGRSQSAEVITSMLAELSLTEQADLPGKALSAGQRRRTALARVFLSAAPVWLLDEPYTHLDVAGWELLNHRIRQHLAGGGLVIMTTHDSKLLPRPADKVVKL